MTTMFNFQRNIRVVHVSLLMMTGFAFAATNYESANFTTADGKFLLNAGTNHNDSLMKLVGTAVLNGISEVDKNLTDIICRYHPCTQWGTWSVCPVKHGYSMAKRSRECNRTQDKCTIGDQVGLTTTETKVCENPCPWHYSNTGGFCLKLKTQESSVDAKKICGADGGNLVNINSAAKSNAVFNLAKMYLGLSIWINGHRTTVNEPWTYTVGPVTSYSNWQYRQPANKTGNELCKAAKVIYFPSMAWTAEQCDFSKPYVCEIQM